MHHVKAVTVCVPVVLALATMSTIARANIVDWDGGGDGVSWHDPLNWSGDNLPGPSDEVRILFPNVTVVHSAGDHTVRSVASQGSLTLSGGALGVTGTVVVSKTFLLQGGILWHATVAAPTTLTASGSWGYLDGVTIGAGAVLRFPPGTSVTAWNGLTVDGTVRIEAFGIYGSSLYFDGTQTLDGTGEVVLASDSPASATVYASGAGTVLTIANGLTVHGEGSVSGGSGTSWINQGTIRADPDRELTLGAQWSNQGTLQATGATLNLGGTVTAAGLGTWSGTGGGTVNLTGTLTMGSGDMLQLDGTTGSLRLRGGTIAGGTIMTVAGSEVIATGYWGYLDGVTIGAGAVLRLSPGTGVMVWNGLTVDGTVRLEALGMYGSSLYFDGTQTLDGTGEVVLASDSPASATVYASGAGTVLTIANGLTVHGEGSVSGDSGTSWINQGTIRADAGKELTLGAQWSNQGTLQATGATLNLGGTVTAAGLGTWSGTGGGTVNLTGTLTMGSGDMLQLDGTTGSLRLRGGTIAGGTIMTVAGSEVIATEYGGILDGVTIGAGAVLRLPLGTGVTAWNGLTVDGTVRLEAVGNWSSLYFDGTQTLDGTGEVVLAGAGSLAQMYASGAGTDVTIGNELTVHGEGSVNGDWWTWWVNQGTIRADAPDRSLRLTGTDSNEGTIQASSSGIVVLENCTLANIGGRIQALDNSVVELQSAAIAEGTLSTTGNGIIRATVGTNTIASAVTNAVFGQVLVTNSASLTLSAPGPYANDGVFKADNSGSLIVDVNVTGAGGWSADGGTIRLNAGVSALTAGPIAINNDGLLELANAEMSGSDLNMDATGRLTVNSSIRLSDDLKFRMSDESRWTWAAGAVLTMTGGVDGCNVGSWATLEVAGTEMGQGTGYSNNFDLSELAISAGAAVALVDFEDNGNGAAAPEVLYADTLILGTGAKLNLNGLNLYVGGSQIVPGAFGGGEVVNTALALIADLDCDGGVDLGDYVLWEPCLTGPGVAPGASCLAMDLDGDGDVDLGDFGRFQEVLTGTP